MATFKLTVVSPQGKAFEGECDSFSAAGREGDFGVLPGHAPMLAVLRRGISKVAMGDTTTYFVTGAGLCEVTHAEVNVVVDSASKVASLDEARTLLAPSGTSSAAKH